MSASFLPTDKAFMLTAATEHDFPSGPWTGFYQFEGSEYPQQLMLRFVGGVITGGGMDNLGEFTIKGSYELDTREVRWTKNYQGGRSVVCRGFREGRGIWGTWSMPDVGHSGFHVWPRTHVFAA
ncbi:MAG: hypothetical protein EXS02_15070 [Planctomycetes bacterium]|nr:hypothetical protein [Planctomycetota bacterium]